MSYVRVSTPGQVEGDGFPRQREAIDGYATKAGIQLVGEFADAGVSGTLPLGERPGLTELFERVLANGIRLILIEKADRLARDLIEGELILRELRKADVRVVEVDGGTDMTADDSLSPTATLIRQVLGAVAQFEKSALTSKLRAARDRVRRHKGRCEGPRPFGELPGEEAALARVLTLARKPRGKPRRSLREIARILNHEGVPTRSGGPWQVGTLATILRRHGKR